VFLHIYRSIVVHDIMLIQDKYELVEQIGSGGFSRVYKGRHYMKNHFVAVKFDHDEQSKILIRNEISIYLSLLKKDALSFVNIKSFGTIENRNYIIMDYISCNLEHYVKTNKSISSQDLLTKLITTINKLHKCGYVHRDLKPDNLLVKNEQVYLIDLGFATKISDKPYYNMIGSHLFSSYNVYSSKYQYRTKDDILSCFNIIFYLFCEKPLPWETITKELDESEKIKSVMYHMKKYTDFTKYYKLEYESGRIKDVINKFNEL